MSESKTSRCPACEHDNPTTARFCNQCGARLGSAPADYTPRHLSDKILRMRSALEGERKQVTVMFVDVRGSVALSRQVEAEQWHHIMDRFFALLTETIHDYEGTINQYTGDGVMALFGAPLAHEDHARRACRAALAIRRRLLRLADELEASHGLSFAARVGLNSGEVVVGKIGDDLRMDYTAQGQTVGLAARMEELARPNTVLISGFTAELVEGYFDCAPRGEVSVEGYDDKLKVFELLSANQPRWRFGLGHGGEAPPLVGRDRELSLLGAYRERVERERRGLLVALTSDTGMGKSRLVFELQRQCRELDIPVYTTRGASHHRAEPLLPLLQFYRSFFELDEEESPEDSRRRIDARLAELAPLPQRLVDNLLDSLGLRSSEQTLPGDSQLRMDLLQQLLVPLLEGGAGKQHAVCIVENLHWLDDAATRDYFDRLFALVPRFPVLVVITARSDYALRWDDLPYFRHISLRPLDHAQSLAVLDRLLGEDEELASLKQDIAEQSGGSPMFLEEAVRHLISQGVLKRVGDRVRLKRRAARLELPPSVQAVVAARIDALPEASKRLLQLIAVIGRRVSLTLLAELVEPADLERNLEELLEQEFLLREPGDVAALAFTQSLFQTVAYRMLLSDQRRELHLRVARALEAGIARNPTLTVQAARHFADAGRRVDAAQWWLRAAEDGARQEIGEALRLLAEGRALFAGEDELSGAERAICLRLTARWMHLAARARVPDEQMRAAVAQGRALIAAGAPPALQAFYHLADGTRQLLASEAGPALEAYHSAVDLATQAADPAMGAIARVGLVYGLQAVGDLAAALEQADEGLRLTDGNQALGAEYIGHSPWIALTIFKAWISAWLGRLQQARSLATAALGAAQQREDAEQVIAGRAVSAFVAAEMGDTDTAAEQAQAALTLACRTENAAAEVVALMAVGRVHLRSRQWVQAIPSLEDAVERARFLALGLGEEARMQSDLALAHLASGNARAAREHAAVAVKAAAACGARLVHAESLLTQIRAGLYSRRPLGFLKRYGASLDEARRLIDACNARLLEPQWLELRARWLALRSEDEAAATAGAEAAALRAEFGLAPAEEGVGAQTG